MTSATNIPVHVKKNRTAGDWAILILLIVGGLVMLFPFIVLLLNAFKTRLTTTHRGRCHGRRSSAPSV